MLEKGIVRFSLVLLLIVGGLALSAPWLGLPDPEEVNLAAKLSASSAQHLWGRNHLGRDVLSG
jgi:ABC-type dipeptide/oligopeptide/nickel transport system permease subunit